MNSRSYVIWAENVPFYNAFGLSQKVNDKLLRMASKLKNLDEKKAK